MKQINFGKDPSKVVHTFTGQTAREIKISRETNSGSAFFGKETHTMFEVTCSGCYEECSGED